MELTVNLETVAFIITKAREFDAKVDPDDPDSGSNASDDRAIDVLEDLPGDVTEEELAAAIANLDDDASLDLVALMWVGRGDFSAEEWHDARDQARTIPRADRGRYLMGTPLLPDLLEQGLDTLGVEPPEPSA